MNKERDPFEVLVVREMNGEATPEEAAYLKTRPHDHRTTLITILLKNKALINRLRTELDAFGCSHEHEIELKQRIGKATSFILRLQAQISKVNAYIKSHQVEHPARQSSRPIDMRIAHARIRGYGEAIHHFDDLLEGGLTREQAMEACITYIRSENDRLKLEESKGEA